MDDDIDAFGAAFGGGDAPPPPPAAPPAAPATTAAPASAASDDSSGPSAPVVALATAVLARLRKQGRDGGGTTYVKLAENTQTWLERRSSVSGPLGETAASAAASLRSESVWGVRFFDKLWSFGLKSHPGCTPFTPPGAAVPAPSGAGGGGQKRPAKAGTEGPAPGARVADAAAAAADPNPAARAAAEARARDDDESCEQGRERARLNRLVASIQASPFPSFPTPLSPPSFLPLFSLPHPPLPHLSLSLSPSPHPHPSGKS